MLTKYFSRFVLLFLFLQVSGISANAQSPAPIKMVDVILRPDHDDWNYKTNEDATVEITVLKYGVPVQNAQVSLEAGPQLLPTDKREKLTLENGRGKINAGTSRQPGFRRVLVTALVNNHSYTGEVTLAFSPEKILPAITMPDDFTQFWAKAMDESSKIPMDTRLSYMPDLSTYTVDVYLVNLQNYKAGQRLYGYLCKPKTPGKYPVIFEPPGAGIKAIAPNLSLASQGFITFSSEIHGLSPLLDKETYTNISNAFGDYTAYKLDDRDNYYYKRVYLGCLRAIDYLCSLPEFDGKNVLVTGGSQGGALAIVTAALDKRVTAVSAFYPALSDITGYLQGRAGGWPHLLNANNALKHNTPEKIRTLEYYDVVNFAKNLSVPGFYSWGYNDQVTPPSSVFAVVNSIKAPKTIEITPISGHWRFGETNQKSIDWLKKQVKPLRN